jgi:hypothetical protein
MSRFTDAAATMQTLSLAAMEEASRFGMRDADVDHLLLALTLDAGIAGQVLRSLDLTLDRARAAVAAEQAEPLAELGVSVTGQDDQSRIVFHETSGYTWTDRAVDVLKRASSGGRNGDSASVLRTLLEEPSGLIEQIVGRVGIRPSDIVARLDAVAGIRRDEDAARPSLQGTHSAFVPASVDEVWTLLSDAQRLPQWESMIAEVTPGRSDREWDAVTRRVAPDGRPLKVKDDMNRQRAELVRYDEPFAVSWRLTYPEARANARVVSFELEPAAGGTQVRITFGWERDAGRRGIPFVRALLRPIARFVIFIQLTQISSAISRVFR